eukprot:2601351-Prymnesium_polylepis.1
MVLPTPPMPCAVVACAPRERCAVTAVALEPCGARGEGTREGRSRDPRRWEEGASVVGGSGSVTAGGSV